MAIDTKLQNRLIDYEGRRYRTTATGLEDITGQRVSGEVSAIDPTEFQYLQSGGSAGSLGGRFTSRYLPTYEQQFGTVQAVQTGNLDRALTGQEIPMLQKAGVTANQLQNVGAPEAIMSPAQELYKQLGRLPTREEMVSAGISVPTEIPQRLSLASAQPASNIVPSPSAPAGWGIDLATGKFAKLPETQAESTQSQEDALGKNLLSNVPLTQFQTPSTQVPFNVSSLGAAQQQAQGFVSQAQQATSQLLGESAFRQQKEQEFGLPQLTQTQRDLTSQLTALQAEAAAIPINIERNIANQGVTTEIAGRQERQLLQDNALKALSVATMLEAVNGNITTAQELADRAVAAKFDPVREQLAVATTNLQLLQNSPQYSAEEKKQAAQMELVLNAQKSALDAATEQDKFIRNIVIDIASKNPEIPSSILNQILNAGSDIEAVRLASPFLQTSSLLGLSDQQLSQFNTITSNIRQDPDIKEFIGVRDSFNRVVASAQNPSPAGDLALIFNYMKILDPGSVVRESEFANAQTAQPLLERLGLTWDAIKRVWAGERLSDGARADFMNRAKSLFDQKLASHEDAIAFYEKQANAFGLPTDLLIRDYVGTSDEPINIPSTATSQYTQPTQNTTYQPLPSFDFSGYNYSLTPSQ